MADKVDDATQSMIRNLAEKTGKTLEEWIVQAGRQVRQRTTTYGDAPATQRLASFGAAPLDPLVNTPFRKFEKSAPRKAVALS